MWPELCAELSGRGEGRNFRDYAIALRLRLGLVPHDATIINQRCPLFGVAQCSAFGIVH